MYTGRTDSTASDGKRLFTDRITATSDGLLAYRLGSTTKATHASAGEFATIRITLVKNEDGSFTRTFWLKNETDKAITYEGESYEVGEFIPYISGSTGYENTDKWSDVGDVNCVTFLPASGHIGDLCLDDCYIGGEFRYVSK